MEEPHQLGQAGHHDEDDGGGVGPQGGHQGARVDGVLGQPHHLLHCASFLSSSVLLDLQARRTENEARAAMSCCLVSKGR